MVGLDSPTTKEHSKPMLRRGVSTISRIEVRRRQMHMTQAELAEKVGVTQGAISMIENGDRSPSLDVLIKLASVLNCKLDDLVMVNREEDAG